jgi:hypothetical protein
MGHRTWDIGHYSPLRTQLNTQRQQSWLVPGNPRRHPGTSRAPEGTAVHAKTRSREEGSRSRICDRHPEGTARGICGSGPVHFPEVASSIPGLAPTLVTISDPPRFARGDRLFCCGGEGSRPVRWPRVITTSAIGRNGHHRGRGGHGGSPVRDREPVGEADNSVFSVVNSGGGGGSCPPWFRLAGSCHR